MTTSQAGGAHVLSHGVHALGWRRIKLATFVWVLVNLAMVALSVVFGIAVFRELSHSRRLPPPPAARPQPASHEAAPEPTPAPPAGDKLDSYNTVVARSLFSPSRSEGAAPSATAAATAPQPPKLVLHGLVLDGDDSLAYLEDQNTKRVVAYHVGDPVAGGQLAQVTLDRVLIARAEGAVEILLNDPAKVPAAPAGKDKEAGGTGAAARPAAAPGRTPVQSAPRPASPAPAKLPTGPSIPMNEIPGATAAPLEKAEEPQPAAAAPAQD